MTHRTTTKLPSPARTLWKGFNNRKARYASDNGIPDASLTLPEFTLSARHFEKYRELCGLKSDSPLFYPLTFAYPMPLRLLSEKEIPFSIFRMLNRRISVRSQAALTAEMPVRIHTAISQFRQTPKGIDLDVTTEITSQETPAWSCTNTFFFKGAGIHGDERTSPEQTRGTPDAMEESPSLEGVETSWFLEDGMGFAFARVCGDSNGIHYSHRYAKMMGFKGAFAQPMMVLDRCLEEGGWYRKEGEGEATAELKGQLYYGRILTLKSIENHHRLYCDGNPKPCIAIETT